MHSILRILIKGDQVLAKAEAGALILMISVMTVVIFLQIVFRYAFVRPLHWSEESARYLFVWLSVVGAALGVQKGGHFGLDFFNRMLSGKGRRWINLGIHLLMGIVVLVILIQGIILVQKTSLQESPAMAISMSWAYASIPVAAGLMAVHLLTVLLKEAMADDQNKKT